MVSSTLNIGLQELLTTLERIRQEYGVTAEYKRLRQVLPEGWPI
jgi:hypothetical protein